MKESRIHIFSTYVTTAVLLIVWNQVTLCIKYSELLQLRGTVYPEGVLKGLYEPLLKLITI